MYNNAVDQVKGSQTTEEPLIRLATVKSISDGRAYVQFYGDDSPSAKLYPYIYGYKPTVNDNVVMLKQGITYVILGKLQNTSLTDGYLDKAAADLLYLTQAVANTLYMPIGSTLETDKLKSGNNQVALSGQEVTPGSNGNYSLGTSSKHFKDAYIDTVNATNLKSSYMTGAWSYNLGASGTEYLSWSTSGTILPRDTNAVSIGSSSKQLNLVYAKQFYQNGTAISTSDKRKKKTIKDIGKKYVEFFKKLRPVSFLFKDGESGRTHTGFIAQEVEEAAGEAGIDNKDLAFLCIDPDGNYGLRYEELIAIQTKVIQDMIERVEKLEEAERRQA